MENYKETNSKYLEEFLSFNGSDHYNIYSIVIVLLMKDFINTKMKKIIKLVLKEYYLILKNISKVDLIIMEIKIQK